MRKTFFIILLLFMPIFIFAAYDLRSEAGLIKNPWENGPDDLPGTIKTMINSILELLIPVLFLAFVYVGFLWVSAQGEPEKLKKAKSALIYTVVGTAIILSAGGIYMMLEKTWEKAERSQIYLPEYNTNDYV